MPHIVIDGNIDFNLVQERFQRNEHRYYLQEKLNIIKLTDCFQNELKNKILIQTISIENESSTEYFIELMKKSSQITIRLFPLTNPSHKTPNIFRSIAIVFSMLRKTDKNIKFVIIRTNIMPYLVEFFE